MENEKKVYEEPTVTMVEFDCSDRISASGCNEFPDEVSGCNSGPS